MIVNLPVSHLTGGDPSGSYFTDDLLIGGFFLLLGSWWIFQVYRRYWDSAANGNTFVVSASYNSQLPLDGILKILCSSIGLFYEIITWLNSDVSRNMLFQKTQYSMVYFFFIVNGIVDLVNAKSKHLPPHMDYVTSLMAFSVPFFLFYFNLGVNSPLEGLCNYFVAMNFLTASVGTITETFYPNSFLVALIRPCFILISGLWFWFCAFLLYGSEQNGPRLDPHDHQSRQIVTVFFTWHLAIGFIVQIVVGLGVSCCYKSGRRTKKDSMITSLDNGTRDTGDDIRPLLDS